jgi:sulfite exporter TauE/SafE
VTGELIWAFLTGLAGSLHCLGMCGPLVIAYSLHLRPSANTDPSAEGDPWSTGVTHHVAFHLGRLAAYGFLGALSAGLVHLTRLSHSFAGFRGIAVIAMGLAMVFFGLILLKVVPMPPAPWSVFRSADKGSARLHSAPYHRFIARHLTSKRLFSRWLLGGAVGFLPCMLSWALVARAASMGNAGSGFLIMVFFGLGTVPLLLSAGVLASLVTIRVRLAGERVAAFSVLAMGVIVVYKGVSRLV